EPGKAIPAPEHVADRLEDRGRARQSRTVVTQPDLELDEKGCTLILADRQALWRAQPVDGALDIEQGVDALDRLQRNRRDRRRHFATPRVGRDIGQFEELTSGVSPAECRDDLARRTGLIIKAVVAAIGVHL